MLWHGRCEAFSLFCSSICSKEGRIDPCFYLLSGKHQRSSFLLYAINQGASLATRYHSVSLRAPTCSSAEQTGMVDNLGAASGADCLLSSVWSALSDM